MFLNSLTEGERVKAWQCNLASTECRRSEHRGKIGDMEDRRCVQIYATFSILHPIVEIVRVRQNVRVRQHHALRFASRAAGVDHCQNRFRVVTDLWRGIIWLR